MPYFINKIKNFKKDIDYKMKFIKITTILLGIILIFSYCADSRLVRTDNNGIVLSIEDSIRNLGYTQDVESIKNSILEVFPLSSLVSIKNIKETQNKMEALRLLIKNQVRCSSDEDPIFELPDILQYKEASCLGYSQLVSVLGNAIGLNVEIINVYPNHNCNIIIDGKDNYLFDLAQNYISDSAFDWDENYTTTEESKMWLLRNGSTINPTYRIVQKLKCEDILSALDNEYGVLVYDLGNYEEAGMYWQDAYDRTPYFAKATYNLA